MTEPKKAPHFIDPVAQELYERYTALVSPQGVAKVDDYMAHNQDEVVFDLAQLFGVIRSLEARLSRYEP